MPLLPDAHAFLTRPDGRVAHWAALESELIEQHADFGEWADEGSLDSEFDDAGLTVIDEIEFADRYIDDPDAEPSSTLNDILRDCPLGEEQRQKLQRAGYVIEDMGAVYGPGWWEGEFRWVCESSGEFQDFEPLPSAPAAWLAAWSHYVQRQFGGA